jgi:hypothetical protein
MKNLILVVVALGLVGCGGSGSGGSGTVATQPAATPVPKNTYSIVVTGDNVQFNSGSFDLDIGFADHSQVTIIPTTIPAGQQFQLDELAYNLRNLVIQVDNMNGTASMTAKLFRNGVQVETTTLFSNGNFHNFSNW